MKSSLYVNTVYLSMLFASSLLLLAVAFSGSAHAAVIAVGTGGPTIYVPGASANYYGYGYHHGYYYGSRGEYHHGNVYRHGNAYHHGNAYRHGNVNHNGRGARR